MRFGSRVRELRLAKGMTQRQVAEEAGVSTSYISKVEGERLHFGDFPSERFLTRLAGILDADLDELLLLTDRVPEIIRKRVSERPDEFRLLASLTDIELLRIVDVAKERKENRT